MDSKDVRWVGGALADQRALPPDVRHELGVDLRRVQQGLLPRDWKTMTTVGAGVMEIRVRVEGAFRLMYVAKYAEAVYVLHVFQKKTQKTSDLDIAIARRRLATVRRTREGR
jgi:phage-related protein